MQCKSVILDTSDAHNVLTCTTADIFRLDKMNVPFGDGDGMSWYKIDLSVRMRWDSGIITRTA
jgi:hypothetical protein